MLRLLISVLVLMFVCTVTLSYGKDAKSSHVNQCVKVGKISEKGYKILNELQRAVEAGPMYTIPAASLGVLECRMKEFYPDTSLILDLEYRFKKEGWLKLRRTESIEMTYEEAHFTLAPTEDAVSIMKREEKEMMGEEGCGIDWQNPKMNPYEFDKNIIETVYRGEVCNCHINIHRDQNNRVINLIISSAC